MTKLMVKIDQDILEFLVEFFRVKGLASTEDYLQTALEQASSFDEIEEDAKNFQFLEEYASKTFDGGWVWFDIDDLPEVEKKGSFALTFRNYITSLREQGEKESVH